MSISVIDVAGSLKRVQVEECPHPGYIRGLCLKCAKPQAEDVSGVAYDYIHKVHSN